MNNNIKDKGRAESKIAAVAYDKTAIINNVPFNLISGCGDFRDSRKNRIPVIITTIKERT